MTRPDVGRHDPLLLPEEQVWFPVLEMCSQLSNPMGDWKSLPHLAPRQRMAFGALNSSLEALRYM